VCIVVYDYNGGDDEYTDFDNDAFTIIAVLAVVYNDVCGRGDVVNNEVGVDMVRR